MITQGDSGGPLTVVNDEGSHVLVGIVSKRLGESCSQQDYAVFTSVSALLPWIESSIKENGGMASCGFNFSAPPTLGILIMSKCLFVQGSTNKAQSNPQEHHWSLPLHLDSSSLVVNRRKDSFLPSRPSALKIVRFLLSPRLAMVLDPSSPPPSRHSWPYVEGGGWENQSPQIASHSM